MPKKLILHIGYPRTATTWLQKEFFPKVKNYIFHKKSQQIITGELKLNSFPDKLIISSEEIVNISGKRFPQDLFKNYKYILHKYKEVEILVFIREQTDLIASEYSFNSTNVIYSNFENYFSKIKLKKWKYFSHLKFFEEIPNSNIHIKLFEDFRNNKIKFAEKLKTEFGFDIDLNKVNFSKKNQSPPAYTIPLILLLKKIYPKFGIYSYLIFNHLPGEKFKVPKEYAQKIKNLYYEENRKLDEKYNLGMKKYNYY